MLFGLLISTQIIFVSAVIKIPFIGINMEAIPALPGLNVEEANNFAIKLKETIRSLERELVGIEKKLKPSHSQEEVGTALIDEPVEALKARKLELSKKPKHHQRYEWMASRLKEGAVTHSDEMLAKIARIKAEFAASNPPVELVEREVGPFDIGTFYKVEYLPGLSPGEAKWNLDKLTKLRMVVAEQVSNLKIENDQVKAALSSNSLNLALVLPKSLQSQLKALRKPAEKLVAAKDYLKGLNDVLFTTESKLKAID
jgi:hypothetical protein